MDNVSPHAAVPIGSRHAHRDRLAWALIAAALLVQYVMFRGYVERELAPGYPGMYDQAGYLFMTYSLHEVIRDHGLVAGLKVAWEQRMPQTLLFIAEGAFLMLLTGGTRLGALTLGFLHFAALQAVLAFVLRRLSGGWTASALGLGLLLSARTVFGWGGVTDFRIDFSAMCLYGIVLCAVLVSDTLASRRGWLHVGVVAAYLVLFRYLTIVYLFGLLVSLGVLLLLAARRWPSAAKRWSARRRGLYSSLLALVMVVIPLLWASREHLKSYYVRGQRDVAVVQQGMAGGGGLEYWLSNVSALRDKHTGHLFLILAGTSLILGWLATRRQRERHSGIPAAVVSFDAVPASLMLGLAVTVPLAVLTLNPAKSEIVGGIVVPGLVLLAVFPVLIATRRGVGAVSRRVLVALASVAVIAGLGTQGALYARHLPASERADTEEAMRFLLASAKLCREMEWRHPLIFADSTNEFTQPNAAAVASYEHLGWLFTPRVQAGLSAWAPALPRVARAAFRTADIVFLTRRPPPGFEQVYPFDRSIVEVRRAWPAQAERDLVLIGRGTVQNWVMEAYARPTATMIEPLLPAGAAWAWITSSGVTLRSSAMLLRARPWVRLEGQARFDWLGGEMPGVSATVIPESGAPFSVPVVAARQDVNYSMDVFCDPAKLPPAGRVLIHLDFDRTFRPVDVGMSPDTQQLVMAAPQSVHLFQERPQPPAWAVAAVDGRVR